MKKIILIFTLLGFTQLVKAQNTTINIGLGVQSLSYTTDIAPALELGVNKNLNNKWSINTNLGISKGSGCITGTHGNGQTTTSYSICEKETVVGLDITGLYSFTGNDKKFNFRGGMGVSYIHDFFQYPKDVFVDKGIVSNDALTKFDAGSLMGNIVLISDYKVNQKFTLGIKGIFRSNIIGNNFLSREIRGPGSFQSHGNPMQSDWGIFFRAGYIL
jgi:hypothetical protein